MYVIEERFLSFGGSILIVISMLVDWVEVVVIDNGFGMDEVIIKRVFDLFFIIKVFG